MDPKKKFATSIGPKKIATPTLPPTTYLSIDPKINVNTYVSTAGKWLAHFNAHKL